MKRIYLTLGVLAAFTTGVFAQTDLSLEPYSPVDNQQYPNYSAGDTLIIGVILKNNGPDNLDPTDSVYIQHSLDWVLPFTGYGYGYRAAVAGGAELNAMTAGGQDTFTYRFIQGASLGPTDDGDAIVTIPTNAVTNLIGWKTFGVTYASGITLLNDPGSDVDAEGIPVMDGNNVIDIQNVKFGTPAGITVIKDNSALTVYPNPVLNTANISYNVKSSSNVTASVMDIAGRIIMTKDFGTSAVGTQTFSLDVSSLNSGVYMLEINADNNRATSKFTVK